MVLARPIGQDKLESMLKITRHKEAGRMRLELVGTIAGAWVGVLERCWREVVASHPPSVLVDLAEVTFVDQAGKALLKGMWKQGAELSAGDSLTRFFLEEITRGNRNDPLHTDRIGQRSHLR